MNDPRLTCKCGVVFVYLKTKNDKWIPIVWDSIDEEEKKSILMGMQVPYQKFTDTAPPAEKHKTHFIDCPYSKQFRKRVI